MSSTFTIELSKKRIVAVVSGGLLLISGAAFGSSANNSPSSGYLLCVSKSTKIVTFPGVLKCPVGSSTLVLGAQGEAGMQGVAGEQGASGAPGIPGAPGLPGINASSTVWSYSVKSTDIVGPGTVTTFAGLKKVIIAVIAPKDLNGGVNYQISADLAGNWGPSANSGAYIQCYFQDGIAYPSGSTYYGAAQATNNSWSGINLRVSATSSDYGLNKSLLYLVCATDQTVSNLSGVIHATAYKNLGLTSVTTLPSI